MSCIGPERESFSARNSHLANDSVLRVAGFVKIQVAHRILTNPASDKISLKHTRGIGAALPAAFGLEQFQMSGHSINHCGSIRADRQACSSWLTVEFCFAAVSDQMDLKTSRDSVIVD